MADKFYTKTALSDYHLTFQHLHLSNILDFTLVT